MAITQKVLLISEAAIKAQSMIQLNADSKVLSRSILDTQFIYLRPIMGDALYDQVLTAVAASQPPTNPIVPLTDDLKTLIVEYIQPYLIHAVVQDTIINLHYKITGKGLLKYNDTQAVAISQDEIEYAKNYHDNRVTAYKGVLIRFLAEVYPLNSGGCNNGRDTDVTSEATGWLLGNAKGCGTGGQLPDTQPPTPPGPTLIPGNGTYFGSDHSVNIGSNPEAPNEGLLRQNTLFSFMEDGTNSLVPYVKLDPLTGAYIGARTVEMVEVAGTDYPDTREATRIEANNDGIYINYLAGAPDTIVNTTIDAAGVSSTIGTVNNDDPENPVNVTESSTRVMQDSIELYVRNESNSIRQTVRPDTLSIEAYVPESGDALANVYVSPGSISESVTSNSQYDEETGGLTFPGYYAAESKDAGGLYVLSLQDRTANKAMRMFMYGPVIENPETSNPARNWEIRDDMYERGLEYADDYSANFTDWSLVNKKYVDDAIASGGGGVSDGNAFYTEGGAGNVGANSDYTKGLVSNPVELTTGNPATDTNITAIHLENGYIALSNYEQNVTDPENILPVSSRSLTVDNNRVQLSVSENDEMSALVADSSFYYRADGLQHNVTMANGNTTVLNADQYTAQLGMSNPTYSYNVGIDSFGRVNMIATQVGSGAVQQIAIGNTNDLSAHTMVVTDAVNGRGLEYDNDYSATFTDRSLVDKAYVDNATGGGGGSLVPLSGMYDDGAGNILLGYNPASPSQGALTQNTTIRRTASGTNGSLVLRNDRVELTLIAPNKTTSLTAQNGTVQMSYFNSSVLSQGAFTVNDSGAQMGYVTILTGITQNIIMNGAMIVTDSVGKGLEYAADYSATFTDRSLVDKAYADSQARPYQSIMVLLTQSSGDPTIDAVLENQFGANLTAVYNGTGNYKLVSDLPIFTILKTVITAHPINAQLVRTSRNNDYEININSLDLSGSDANGVLLNTPIEIRVYT